MLQLYKGRVGIFFLVSCVMAISVVVFSLTQVDLGVKKADANAIVSPWDFSLAPPQALNKNAVRIISPAKAVSASKAKSAKLVKKWEEAKTTSVASAGQTVR